LKLAVGELQALLDFGVLAFLEQLHVVAQYGERGPGGVPGELGLDEEAFPEVGAAASRGLE
jgi:hypothetical protein